LVVDALYKVVSGHLVDEYDMRQFVDQMDILIKQFGIAIIIVHHPRKQQLYEGQIIDMGGEDSLGPSSSTGAIPASS